MNVIVVYDWEGNYIRNIRVRSWQEIESLFHIGEDVYIAFNADGNYVNKASLRQD